MTCARPSRWLAAAILSVAPAAAKAQSETVQVVGERSILSGCDALGIVRGSSFMGVILESAGWESSVEEMKSKALELGGTHLLLREVKNGLVGSSGWGEVFACAIKTAPPPRRSRGSR